MVHFLDGALGDITGAPNTRRASRGKGKRAKGGKPQQQRKRKNKKARSRRTPRYDASSSGGESSAAEENIDYAAAARAIQRRGRVQVVGSHKKPRLEGPAVVDADELL